LGGLVGCDMLLDKARNGGRRSEGTDVAMGGASGTVSNRRYYDFSDGMRNEDDAMCVLAARFGEFVRTPKDRCADDPPGR
jgi:hypothetical protein